VRERPVSGGNPMAGVGAFSHRGETERAANCGCSHLYREGFHGALLIRVHLFEGLDIVDHCLQGALEDSEAKF
jgi:hypothetical protein